MENRNGLETISVNPRSVRYYVPPVVWKGDPVGHIGECDLFFWILEGEVILLVDSDYYLVRAGQLAFLPKGKNRRYTQISKNFAMYTMRFWAEAEGENLMQMLGLTEGKLVADVENKEEITHLFESVSRVEVHADPMILVGWSANVLRLIQIFGEAVRRQSPKEDERFAPVIGYMRANRERTLTIEELADIAHMQPTYFIRRFKNSYGVPPLAYFRNMRVQLAVELLLTTDMSIDEIARQLGMEDASYFSRWFKKSCNVSPSEYKKVFCGI